LVGSVIASQRYLPPGVVRLAVVFALLLAPSGGDAREFATALKDYMREAPPLADDPVLAALTAGR
jgi:hypothetical protein